MSEEKKIEREYDWSADGSLLATMIYPEKDVVLTIDGKEHAIGKEKSWKVTHVISPDKVSLLLLHLEQQKQDMENQINNAKRVQEELSALSNELTTAFVSFANLKNNDERLRTTKCQELDKLAHRINNKITATANANFIGKELVVVNEQIDFIKQRIKG